eukprot:3908669-Pleurochrysis_carterae.AAC.1
MHGKRIEISRQKKRDNSKLKLRELKLMRCEMKRKGKDYSTSHFAVGTSRKPARETDGEEWSNKTTPTGQIPQGEIAVSSYTGKSTVAVVALKENEQLRLKGAASTKQNLV